MRRFFDLLDIFAEFDVDFISITEHCDPKVAHGRLLRNMVMEFAQYEREMASVRTKDKLEERAKKGLWNGGPLPFGFKYTDNKLVVNEDEAQVIRFMFEYYHEDPSLARLRNELHRKRFFTRSGALWVKTPIDHKLRNPIYCGKIKHNGKIYPGQHEAIVSEELFNKVQELVPVRTWGKTKTERTYLLKGLVKCQHCGSTMTPNYTSKRNKSGKLTRIPYYRCTKTMKHGNIYCDIKSVNADKLEGFVTTELKEISQNKDLIEVTVDDLNNNLRNKTGPIDTEIKNIEKRVGRIDREIDRFVEALGRGKLSVGLLEQKIETRNKDKRALQNQLIQLKSEVEDYNLREFSSKTIHNIMISFSDLFDSLSPSDKQKAIQILLRDIHVYRDKIILNVFELPEFSLGSINRNISGNVWESNPPALNSQGTTVLKTAEATRHPCIPG